MIRTMTQRIQANEDLSEAEAEQAIEFLMSGEASEDDTADLLLALREKGEAVSEVVGAARALRRQMIPIRSHHAILLDTCGTGGAGSGTFNVSTTAAIIVAASGVPVAKHGNRKVSSKSGSADVLHQLGVEVDASLENVERCLDEVGMCFCFAPQLHPSMRHVAQVRQRLAVPTLFNLLGPLCNPAGAQFQLLGVGQADRRPLLAQALQRLGTEHALIVHGRDQLCEISNAAPTDVTRVLPNSFDEMTWTPSDFGLPESSRDAIRAADPEASAAVIRQVLSGKPSAARDIALMNAAAALWLVGKSHSLPAAVEAASESVDSGAAADLLRRLGELSRAC